MGVRWWRVGRSFAGRTLKEEGELGNKVAAGRRSIYCKRQRHFTISGGGDGPEVVRLRRKMRFDGAHRVQRRVVIPWRTDHAAIPALLRG